MCRAGVCFNLSWIRNDYHNIWPSPFYWSISTGDQVVNHVYTSHVVILGAAMCLSTHNLNILIPPTVADTRRSINVGLMLCQSRRRWTNVKPTLIQRLVSAGRPLPLTQSRIIAVTASLMVNRHYSRVGAISWVCQVVSVTPVSKRWNNVGLMMIRRHKRWAIIKPALVSTTTIGFIMVYWFNGAGALG